MLFYSWRRINKAAGTSSKRVMLILEAMLKESMPRNRYDPLFQYYYKDFTGPSFLVDPYALLHSYARDVDKANYLALASFRKFAEYKISGKLTLDLAHSPVGQDALNKNELLHVEGENIHFKYEDYTIKENINGRTKFRFSKGISEEGKGRFI
jgi:hypothetical protein